MSDASLLAGGSHVTKMIQIPSLGREISAALILCGIPGTAKNDVCNVHFDIGGLSKVLVEKLTSL